MWDKIISHAATSRLAGPQGIGRYHVGGLTPKPMDLHGGSPVGVPQGLPNASLSAPRHFRYHWICSIIRTE